MTRVWSALSDLPGCAGLLSHSSESSAQLHRAGYSRAPKITYLGINCDMDDPYPTTPCHGPRSSCVLAWLSGCPCAAHRGTMRGLFLAPPLPGLPQRTRVRCPRSDRAWCSSLGFRGSLMHRGCTLSSFPGASALPLANSFVCLGFFLNKV